MPRQVPIVNFGNIQKNLSTKRFEREAFLKNPSSYLIKHGIKLSRKNLKEINDLVKRTEARPASQRKVTIELSIKIEVGK